MECCKEIIRTHLTELGVDLKSPAYVQAAYVLGRYLHNLMASGEFSDDISLRLKLVDNQVRLPNILFERLDLKKFFGQLKVWIALSSQINDISNETFLSWFQPFLIHNWNPIMETFPNEGNKLYVFLYRCLLIFEEFDGPTLTPEEYEKINQKYGDHLNAYGVDFDRFIELWDYLFFTRVSPSLNRTSHVDKVWAIYQDRGFTKQKMLSDYAQMILNQKIFGATLPGAKDSVVERGLTLREEKIDQAITTLVRYNPTDVIQGLFYSGGRDSPVELSWLLPQIQIRIKSAKRSLFFNPAPAMLKELYGLSGIRRDSIFFAVSDETVKGLYGYQFPEFNFILFSEVADYQEHFDFVAVTARNVHFKLYRHCLEVCRHGGQILYFGHETLLGHKEFLQEQDIWPERILSLKNTERAFSPKKMVLFAGKGREFRYTSIAVRYTQVENEYLVIDCGADDVPLEMLWEEKSLSRIRSRMERQSAFHETEQKKSEIYRVCEEIKLYYAIHRRSDCISARVYYRSILNPDLPQESMRKRGDKITRDTEKGMRSKTMDELLEKIENVAYYPEFYPIIVENVMEHYKMAGTPLSLKCLWFCCRNLLRSHVGYRESMMEALFRGSPRPLWDVIPEKTSSAEIYDAVSAEVGANKAEKYLLQIRLILAEARLMGILNVSILEDGASARHQRQRNRLQEVRKNLARHFFSDHEMTAIYEKATLPSDRKGTKRCVLESIWMISLLRLFTGMPLREILALQWKHFVPNPLAEGCYSLTVLQWINEEGSIVPYRHYSERHRRRKISAHPLLVEALLERLAWLHKRQNFSLEEILDQPIILETEPNRNRRRCAQKFCPISVGRKFSSSIFLKGVDYMPDPVRLLDGEDQFDEDLNTYKGDLFYSNFLHCLRHMCGCIPGEVSYLTGTQPPDTLSGHYVDYSNNFSQYLLYRKLCRWSFLEPEEPECNLWNIAEGTGTLDLESGSVENRISTLDVVVDGDFGELEIELESEHGLDGTVIVYLEEQHG